MVRSWQSRRWGNGGYLARTADRRAQRLHALPRVARKLVPGNPLWQLVIQHLRRRLCNVIVPTGCVTPYLLKCPVGSERMVGHPDIGNEERRCVYRSLVRPANRAGIESKLRRIGFPKQRTHSFGPHTLAALEAAAISLNDLLIDLLGSETLLLKPPVKVPYQPKLYSALDPRKAVACKPCGEQIDVPRQWALP
jgi:hypothetical protein